MDTSIETRGLTKRYGSLAAVDRVSLSVRPGEIYGFLGLNGAGKTTTIRALLGLIRANAGEVSVLGCRILPGRPGPWDRVGYMVEMPYAYPELTVRENLEAMASLRRIKGKSEAIGRIVELLALGPYTEVKARNLSLGNGQRLGLAKALIHRPALLFLDEPSNGLDPAGIVEIRRLLQELAREEGVTVFISSHNLFEISRIATRVGVIHRGRLLQELAADRLDEVLAKSLVLDFKNRDEASRRLESLDIETERLEDGSFRVVAAEAVARPEETNRRLVTAGISPILLKIEQEDLESYFLRITGEQA